MINKILKIIGILLLVLIVFRGMIYRSCVKYKDMGFRSDIIIDNPQLLERIDQVADNKEINLQSIAEIANDLTCQELSFTFSATSNNPNELFVSKRANCIGYSAMFNSIAHYLIQKNELVYEIDSEHKMGQLYFLGINVHEYFDHSFFKDHDYNRLVNRSSGKVLTIDPSVSDYLWIKRVTEN